ncbi:MAG: hypothetical protein MRZ79_27595 [Bacteroidia bacterium]|nr:hypothetical protein [Bacteroidia bacterium]
MKSTIQILSFLSLIGLLLFGSCDLINSGSKQANKAEKQSVSEDKVGLVNPELQKSLAGLWASEEYQQLLGKYNSIHKAGESVSFYTDIFLDKNGTLHCTKPTYMEEDYLELHADSSARDSKGKLVFKILLISDNTLELKDSKSVSHRFIKLTSAKVAESFLAPVGQGSQILESKWFAGKYEVSIAGETFDLELLEDGTTRTSQEIVKLYPFTYEDQDILQFSFSNDSIQHFIIKKHDGSLIQLEGIHELVELDQVLEKNGRNGSMKKL